MFAIFSCIQYTVSLLDHTAANCGAPSPPSDGYLEPYTSTSEGARVNRVHVCQNGQVETEEIVCNSDGQWEVSRSSVCTTKPGIIIADNIIIWSVAIHVKIIVLLSMTKRV